MARGEVRWCQGYSEPGAGSDLASLRTRAEDRGDHYLVNGQKIWTTAGQHAQWCFCLVRTDPTRKHNGISFLLIDMSTPGVDVRPIKMISGDSHFCEVFFTDVEVPKENLVGEINNGWTIAKRLLQFERNKVGSRGRPRFGGDQRPIEELAKAYLPVDSEGRIADAEIRTDIIKHMLDMRALTLLQKRVATGLDSGATSVLKTCRTRINQQREELQARIMGFHALGAGGEGYSKQELDLTTAFLANKATTIYGGTSEIQINIISKRVLGLGDAA
jgi:alkylation response protein AidB-like acyl-CoA dehydrogenase